MAVKRSARFMTGMDQYNRMSLEEEVQVLNDITKNDPNDEKYVLNHPECYHLFYMTLKFSCVTYIATVCA